MNRNPSNFDALGTPISVVLAVVPKSETTSWLAQFGRL
jgi:hypothetical protein